MIKSLPARAAILLLFIVVALISLYPTYVPKDEATGKPILPEWWSSKKFLPQNRMNLGLDLRGGIYLVYTIEVDEVAKLEGENIVEGVEGEEYQKEGVRVVDSSVAEDGEVRITFADDASKQKGGKMLTDKYAVIYDIRADDSNPNAFILKMKANELIEAKKNAIQQVRRTVASRIDQWGLAEVSIQVKQPDQLVIELPGITDTKRVESVINTTANLELKLVVDSGSSEEEIKSKNGGSIPRSMKVYEYKDSKTGLVQSYLMMKKLPDITGECISSARMGYGGQLAASAVVYFNLRPGAACAGKFSGLTGNNIDKQLAIVLDDNIMSAPVIRDRISDSGIIEGQFTAESATDLAIILKTGSLKVPMVKDRVEVIGPSLGRDHIQRGKMALMVGGLFVIVFMVFYYKVGGVFADFAVLLNVLFIMGALATFGATLTLPGLAGIALTVGMAVDANVLINERIREEQRSGKTARASIELGYDKALSAILDSNITTFISGLVLYFNGTGPIKGFAITLMFGIVSSVFTAIFVTRICFDYILEKYPERAINV